MDELARFEAALLAILAEETAPGAARARLLLVAPDELREFVEGMDDAMIETALALARRWAVREPPPS